MTSTQTKPGPGPLSQKEAEELRALLHCTHVAEMDALTRLRTGGLGPGASYLGAARRNRRFDNGKRPVAYRLGARKLAHHLDHQRHCGAEHRDAAHRIELGRGGHEHRRSGPDEH